MRHQASVVAAAPPCSAALHERYYLMAFLPHRSRCVVIYCIAAAIYFAKRCQYAYHGERHYATCYRAYYLLD